MIIAAPGPNKTLWNAWTCRQKCDLAAVRPRFVVTDPDPGTQTMGLLTQADARKNGRICHLASMPVVSSIWIPPGSGPTAAAAVRVCSTRATIRAGCDSVKPTARMAYQLTLNQAAIGHMALVSAETGSVVR
jgi:hypothetical protein